MDNGYVETSSTHLINRDLRFGHYKEVLQIPKLAKAFKQKEYLQGKKNLKKIYN
jgi:hypothetical protein